MRLLLQWEVKDPKSIIKNIIESDKRVLSEPEGLIEISALADSSVHILVRAWVASENYWALYYSVTTEVYKAFNAQGISIPFPQMDVHLQK